MARRRRKRRVTLDGFLDHLRESEPDLLGEVALFIRRYVVLTPAQLVAATLWAAHSHSVMAVEQTPYLCITSPEPRCGKTRLMEVLEMLAARAWLAILPSEAVIYRKVDASVPTLLMDEVDTIFNPRVADKHEGLRALINSGNRRGVKVPRCVGQSSKIAEFNVYCAKALAGIGTLPDTVTDRALPIRLQRRSRDEPVEKLRRREAEPVGADLHDRLAAWTEENFAFIEKARPEPPEELSDRMQDACEPLIAIADRHGGIWPGLVRAAVVELLGAEREDDVTSMRQRLLTDIKGLFEENGRRSMTTERLLEALIALPESPWGKYYARTLEARDLAALLRHYGIRSANLRLKGAEKNKVRKGYRRRDLEDAWQRYT